MWFGTKAVLGASAFIAAPFQSAPVSIFLEDDPAEALPPEVLSWTRPARWWGDLDPRLGEYLAAAPAHVRRTVPQLFRRGSRRDPPMAGGDDGCKALEVVQAAYLSFAERRPVKLPLPPDTHLSPPIWGRLKVDYSDR